MLCLHVYMCFTCVPDALRFRRKHQTPRSWSYGCCEPPCVYAGNWVHVFYKNKSHNCCTISPAPVKPFNWHWNWTQGSVNMTPSYDEGSTVIPCEIHVGLLIPKKGLSKYPEILCVDSRDHEDLCPVGPSRNMKGWGYLAIVEAGIKEASKHICDIKLPKFPQDST